MTWLGSTEPDLATVRKGDGVEVKGMKVEEEEVTEAAEKLEGKAVLTEPLNVCATSGFA